MDSIIFTIDKREVESVAGRKLNPEMAEKVLSMVENDAVLWNDIKKSIADAIESLDVH